MATACLTVTGGGDSHGLTTRQICCVGEKMRKGQSINTRGDILIVDDDLPGLRALSTLLRDEGYEVRSATDGPTALMIATSDPPDLVLLDVIMPGMDGYQVCQQLKRDPETRDIPVIFISALDEVVDKVKGFEFAF